MARARNAYGTRGGEGGGWWEVVLKGVRGRVFYGFWIFDFF